MDSESSNSSNSIGGDQGSSNPNPTPHSPPPTQQFLNERSPFRRSGRANLGAGQLRLTAATSSPRAIRPLTVVPPVMGALGVSAFSRYTRQPPRPASATLTAAGGVPGLSPFTLHNRPPPRPDWHPGAGSCSGASGFGFGYGFGFSGGQFVPAGGRGHGGVAPFEGGALRISGSPAARKRIREDVGAGGAGKQQREGGGHHEHPMPCPICGREFMSKKALFGHMRSHPNRGWKGVHPPPAFRADEEFADVPGLNRHEGMAAAGDGGVAAEVAEGGGDTEMQPRDGAEENYIVPDLNMPPPSSPDQ